MRYSQALMPLLFISKIEELFSADYAKSNIS